MQLPTILKGGNTMRKTITLLTMLTAPLALAACNKAPEATDEVVASETAAPAVAAPEAATDAAAADAAAAAAATDAAGDEAADGQSTTSGVQPIKK